jgi:uncharacterized membrane protein
MWRRLRNPVLALAIAGWFFLFNSAPAVAGLVSSKPASEEVSKINREEDIRTIQRALESKIVQEKLKAYGLSKEEIEKKLSEMDDQQIHILAKASEKVLAGGYLSWLLVEYLLAITILVLILVVVLKRV